jgi:hypothetical protein
MKASTPSNGLRVSNAMRVTWTFESYIKSARSYPSMDLEQPTRARRIYSLISGVAGCSNESSNSVNGDAVSRRLNNFEISNRL